MVVVLNGVFQTEIADVFARSCVGQFPYPTIENEDMLNFLSEGKRLEQPPNCSDEVWVIQNLSHIHTWWYVTQHWLVCMQLWSDEAMLELPAQSATNIQRPEREIWDHATRDHKLSSVYSTHSRVTTIYHTTTSTGGCYLVENHYHCVLLSHALCLQYNLR